MVQVLVGNRRVNCREIASVAYFGHHVVLDTAALEVVRKSANDSASAQQPKKGKTPVEEKKQPQFQQDVPVRSFSSPSNFSDPEVRAIILLRIISIMEGRSRIRPEVVEFLTSLLNESITPVISVDSSATDSEVLSVLASYVLNTDHSSKQVSVNGKLVSYSEALATAKLAPPGLLVSEVPTFTNSLSASVAFAALSTYTGNTLLNLADTTAALTCETVQAFTEPFEPVHTDVCRNQKGQATVANNLRLLLEESKQVNEGKRQEQDPAVIRCIPQYQGPARDAFESFLKVIRVELQSAEATPVSTSPKEAGPFHPQPLSSALFHFSNALLTVASGSLQRVSEMLNNSDKYKLPQPEVVGLSKDKLSAQQQAINAARSEMGNLSLVVSDPSNASALTIARAAFQTVNLLLQTLSYEALVTLTMLAHLDKIALEASIAAIKAKEEATRKREEELKAKGIVIKPKEGKDGAEKKREAKGLSLGRGTLAFRAWLEKAGFALSQDQAYETLLRLLNPLTVVASVSAPSVAGPVSLPYGLLLKAELRRLVTSTNQKMKPKIPKGTRDTMPEQMMVRERAFAIIKEIFLRHGAVGIDTPVFERKDTLTNKYGEDSKLIYDLADQGGEMLSLRYDLTVPFARFCAINGIEQIKRYHIARVYRRDNPQMAKGRFREFYQCDFDIAGTYAPMLPDADCLSVLVDCLEGLKLGNFKIKLNHRKLLDAMMELCGVPPEKFRTICSAIDKLDKEPWSAVKDEMVNEKGLSEEVADRIGKWVCLPPAQAGDPFQLLQLLQESKEPEFTKHAGAVAAFNDLKLLFDYLKEMKALHRISFDLSLARGLDYYTGVIYEAVLTDSNRVGSIAAGGRYDGLIGMFSSKQVPAVGVSIGLERVLTILEEQERERMKGKIRKNQTQVLVATIPSKDVPDDVLLKARLALVGSLWQAGIKTEFLYDLNPKPKKQLDFALENKIPLICWLGGDELKKGVVSVKNMEKEQQTEVKRGDLVAFLQGQIVELEEMERKLRDGETTTTTTTTATNDKQDEKQQ